MHLRTPGRLTPDPMSIGQSPLHVISSRAGRSSRLDMACVTMHVLIAAARARARRREIRRRRLAARALCDVWMVRYGADGPPDSRLYQRRARAANRDPTYTFTGARVETSLSLCALQPPAASGRLPLLLGLSEYVSTMCVCSFETL